MNKYFLTFKNQQTEEQYQKKMIQELRMTTFTLITVSFIIVFVFRIGQALAAKNYINTLIYCGMIVYFVLQYIIAKKKQQFLRLALIILNHVFTIFFLYVEESTDSMSAHLRGANQMGSNMLIILAGEFGDAIFSLISISAIRIVVVFLKSSNIEISAIGSAILIILYAAKYLYQYHKAIRSQYLLTLVDQTWKKICQKINYNNSYILIKFDQDVLHFNVEQIMNCNFLNNNKNEAKVFLQNSLINKQTLENFMYSEIKQFQEKMTEQFNNQLKVEFNKEFIKIDYSIYISDKPTILFLFTNYKNPVQVIGKVKDMKKKYLQLLNQFLLFTQKITEQCYDTNYQYVLICIQRKLHLIQSIESIHLKQLKRKQIEFKNLLQQIIKFYPEKQIIISNIKITPIQSIQYILKIVFFSIFEFSNQQIQITKIVQTSTTMQFTLIGEFQTMKINNLFSPLEYLFSLTFFFIEINDEQIFIEIYNEAYVPCQFRTNYLVSTYQLFSS